MIIPCIDLMNGKAVQLIQGEKKALEIEDIYGLVERFSVFSEIQVIDLDSAKGLGSNKDIIREICTRINCRVGGGIRTINSAREIIDMRAKKIIIGTSAFNNQMVNFGFLNGLIRAIPRERIIIAIDTKDGRVVTKGWRYDTGIRTENVVKELEQFCGEFLYTYVDKEGMMQGTNMAFIRKLRRLTNNQITVAGGIRSIEEIKELENLGVNSALGMGLYTGKIKFEDLVRLNKK